MTDKNLRSLAREYAEGKLEKERYREERDKLIEGILAGTIKVEENLYRPLLDSTEQEHTIDKEGFLSEDELNLPDEPENLSFSPQNLYLLGSAALVVVLAICIVIYMLVRQPVPVLEDEVIDTMDSVDPVPSDIVPETYIVEDLINRFIEKDDWSENSRKSFLENWNTLLPDEKAKALALPISSQLTTLIYEKLIEQRALYLVGDGRDALEKQKMLVEFANAIGIDDPRITVQEMTIPKTGITTSMESETEETNEESGELSVAEDQAEQPDPPEIP